MQVKLTKEDLDTIKIALDSAATKWKAEAEKEKNPQHKGHFLALHSKYAKLCEEFKSYLK